MISLLRQKSFRDTASQVGFIGVLVIGFKRAAFSNEAGIGTEAMAHGDARTREQIGNVLVRFPEQLEILVLIPANVGRMTTHARLLLLLSCSCSWAAAMARRPSARARATIDSASPSFSQYLSTSV